MLPDRAFRCQGCWPPAGLGLLRGQPAPCQMLPDRACRCRDCWLPVWLLLLVVGTLPCQMLPNQACRCRGCWLWAAAAWALPVVPGAPPPLQLASGAAAAVGATASPVDQPALTVTALHKQPKDGPPRHTQAYGSQGDGRGKSAVDRPPQSACRLGSSPHTAHLRTPGLAAGGNCQHRCGLRWLPPRRR